ncbi:hypothetical protein pb186bvf_004846 [Paramecium bursaria]
MAKSQRSKVKRRWRSLKRLHVENTIVKKDVAELSQKLEATIQNRQYRTEELKNAFLHPNDPQAIFPQYKPPLLVDFRSSALPYKGNQYVGALRKKITKTIILKDTEEDKTQNLIEEEQEVHNDEDDLINALENVGVKSKREKRQERKQQGMEITQEEKKPQIKKNRRKKQPLNKTKKLITF